MSISQLFDGRFPLVERRLVHLPAGLILVITLWTGHHVTDNHMRMICTITSIEI